MLKIGAHDITGLYVGETKIAKAYLGGDLIFGAEKKPSRLPDGYTELEYVSANGKQTILTDILPTTNTEIEADVSVDYSGSATTMRLFSSTRISGTYYSFWFQFKKSSSELSGGAIMGKNSGGTAIKISNIIAYEKIHITYNTALKSASIDEESIQFSSNETISLQPQFRLFGASFSTSGGVGNAFYGKIYSFVLKQNGAEKLNFVPCKNADGVAGFYNLADGSFVGSQSSDPFVAGPAV